MGWSSGFKLALKRQQVLNPSYRLVFHNNPWGPGGNFTISGGVDLANQLFSHKDVYISAEGPRVQGCSIIPGDWNISFGGFEVPIVGDIKNLYPNLVRGAFAGLYCTLNGVEERIAFGQLREINGIAPNWTLYFNDLVSALSSQANGKINSAIYSTSAPIQYGRFFNRVGLTATASAYTLGGNTISINKSQYFFQQYGKNGLAKVEMKDAGGAVLGTAHFEWTTKSSTSGSGTLTLSADSKAGNVVYPGDTPLQDFHSGTVTVLAMIHGKPWDLLSYLILSRDGDNTNSLDQLPESWCSGGYLPSDLVDVNDMQLADGYIVSSNTATNYTWSLPVETTWDQGLRTFTNLCAHLGQWPVWRQNAVTYRGCRNLNGQSIYPVNITDDNIIEITRHELFSPNTPNIYGGIQVQYSQTSTDKYGTGFTAQQIPSMPFSPLYTIDAQKYYDPSLTRSHMGVGDLARIKNWVMQPIETVSMVLSLEYAKLCAGDIVQVTSRYLFTPRKGQDYWVNQKAMVTSVNYEIASARCSVQIATYRDVWSYVMS